MIQRERRGLFGNAMVSCAGQGGVIVFGLGAMVVTTRLLGAEGYGRLTVFFMALGILSKLALGWPNLALARFGREEIKSGRGIGRVFWARTWMYAACCAGMAVVLAAAADPLNRYLGIGRGGVWILAGYAALLGGVEMLGTTFQALGRFRCMAALMASFKFLNFLLVLGFILAVARSAEAETVLRLHLVSLGLVLVFAAGGVARSGVGRPTLPEAPTFRRMVAYAWPLVFAGIATVTVEWVDTIVLRAARPIEEVGVYGAAYQSVNVLGGVRVAVMAVLWPFIVSLAVENRHETLRRCLDETMPALAALVGVAFAAAAAGAEVMPWVFGPDFAPGVLPCQILIAAVAFTSVHALATSMANAFDRVKSVAGVWIAMGVVNLVGDLWLVPRIGPLGAAMSTFAAFGVAAVLSLRIVNRVATLRGERPARRYLALFALAPATAIPLAHAFAGPLPWRLVAYVAIVLVWIAGVRTSGLVPRSAFDSLDEIELPRPVAVAIRVASRVLSRPEAGA